MPIKKFIPDTNMQHPYGVGVFTGAKSIMLIDTYPTYDALETGYRKWLNAALQMGIAEPYPVEKKEDGWFIVEKLIFS